MIKNPILFFRLTFNWRTPLGYTVAMILYSFATYGTTCGIVPFVCFFIGSCELFIALIKDITNDVIALSELRKKSHKAKMKKLFGSIIDAFSNVKQFSITQNYCIFSF